MKSESMPLIQVLGLSKIITNRKPVSILLTSIKLFFDILPFF